MPGAERLYQIYMKWFPIDLAPPNSFKGQAALVTGGTGGLGLATAAHLVNLGAAEVIITSRNPSRSKQALEELERETGGRSKGVVRVAELDMNRYDSVVALAEEVKKTRAGKGGLDYVLLNAGVIGIKYKAVDEGWEQALQVNVLSTALLAVLLLPWMKSERANRSSPAHLAIVGSGQHVGLNMAAWETHIAGNGAGGALAHYNKSENWPGPGGMYAVTKLMVHYVSHELAEFAKGENGRPDVIINTTCPGMVKTQLTRQFSEDSPAFALLVFIMQAILAKTPENGARTLIAAGLTKEPEHAKFIRFYGSEEGYKKQEAELFKSDRGRRIRASLWSEITNEFAAKIPAARDTISLYGGNIAGERSK